MLKGLFTATLAPTLSVWLSANGKTKAFCGWHDANGTEYGVGAQVGMFLGIWLASDFFEFFYHYCGHRYKFTWMQHKFHHRFFNPTCVCLCACACVLVCTCTWPACCWRVPVARWPSPARSRV